MKAIRIHELGGADVLRLEEVAKPEVAAGTVLIKTEVAGINYADTMLRKGTYLTRPSLPFTPGFEVAGRIEEVGAGIEGLRVGQRVMAKMQGGGYAEYAVVQAGQVTPMPDGLEFGTATALLAQGLTALGLLKGLQAGQSILVHAAAGGVGSLLVQLAKLKGARVIGTASTAAKLEIVKELGADAAINYTEADWPEQVRAATPNGAGVDLLIEMVGGEVGAQNVKCLAPGATMIIYGAASGRDFPLSALSLLGKHLTVRGYTLYSETEATLAEFTRELMAHVKEHRLQVLVQEFPLAQAADAHRAIEGRQTTGKVVLRVQ
ncbi:MAG: alcohol dehydrogenase [Acidobacteria bacterium]|nr:MAG: alcohol dehydrogenase [Acidobacteriota bacterium]